MQNNPSLTQEQAMAQVKDYFNTKNSWVWVEFTPALKKAQTEWAPFATPAPTWTGS
jgi:hypothetical protein